MLLLQSWPMVGIAGNLLGGFGAMFLALDLGLWHNSKSAIRLEGEIPLQQIRPGKFPLVKLFRQTFMKDARSIYVKRIRVGKKLGLPIPPGAM